MLIIRVMGGLGNQMFQYALYRAMKERGLSVKLDDRYLKKNGNQHNGLELKRVFGLNYDSAGITDIVKNGGDPYAFICRMKRRLLHIENKNVVIEQDFEYKPYLFELENSYLCGYWQSEKYFIEIRDRIINDFKFVLSLSDENQKLVQKIKEKNSVALHIRRGDYLSNENKELYGNICTDEYYQKAIQYFTSNYKDVHFFIFSDDSDIEKNSNINFCQHTIINWNRGLSSYVDMQLMSLCKHNIIANSSFSWWAAWLNTNKEKQVIMPKKWINRDGKNDIFCDGWIRM